MLDKSFSLSCQDWRYKSKWFLPGFLGISSTRGVMRFHRSYSPFDRFHIIAASRSTSTSGGTLSSRAFARLNASNYSRERVASQCDKPIKAQMEAIKTAITSNTDTTPSCSMTNTGPTTSAILKNTTNQANGCAKLMVHPIQGRRRGTIIRGSSAHRYTMPQLFGLAQSRSSSLRFTAIVSMRPNYS